jgi:hypothetical protein
MAASWLYETIGRLAEKSIRLWVRLTGKRVAKASAPWLDCPMGPLGRIGEDIYTYLARQRGLHFQPAVDAGLLPSFAALAGPHFDPEKVHPRVRDFYEHTGCYRLEAWSEAGLLGRFFLRLLVTFVSRRMDQLNFPVSSLELAGGMSSEVLPLVDGSGRLVYTGWLRRLVGEKRIIYAGLYATERPGAYEGACVKVSFPLPLGSATVFLRPEADPDGSFRLISSGSGFGQPGFYRMVEVGAEHWKVRYIRTLREFFHVYVDAAGVLRTEHTVRFLGVTVLRLLYKMERVAEKAGQASGAAS